MFDFNPGITHNTKMTPRVVLDTNVILSAFRSRRGASFKIISMIGTGSFELALSVPLIFEYEVILKRNARKIGLTYDDIDDVLDYFCSVGLKRDIHFLWRPFLPGIQDDMVLELAVESESDYIVTYNLKDFSGIELFQVEAIDGRKFLGILGDIS